jgi:hypothetical protein
MEEPTKHVDLLEKALEMEFREEMNEVDAAMRGIPFLHHPWKSRPSCLKFSIHRNFRG